MSTHSPIQTERVVQTLKSLTLSRVLGKKKTWGIAGICAPRPPSTPKKRKRSASGIPFARQQVADRQQTCKAFTQRTKYSTETVTHHQRSAREIFTSLSSKPFLHLHQSLSEFTPWRADSGSCWMSKFCDHQERKVRAAFAFVRKEESFGICHRAVHASFCFDDEFCNSLSRGSF